MKADGGMFSRRYSVSISLTILRKTFTAFGNCVQFTLYMEHAHFRVIKYEHKSLKTKPVETSGVPSPTI